MGATDKSCENISDLLSIESTEIPKRQLNFVPYIPDTCIFVCVFARAFVHVSCLCTVQKPVPPEIPYRNRKSLYQKEIPVRFQDNPRVR